ncbi:hypothetical protein NE237_000722 [Protea cynaroides]|uniref:SKP1-like protein n=1 Tax=Protea cynaroides TaxID=273540 RepID=A0A9Q0KSN6_9MAGN|nr:hypothetical protein NE237_000722 [Protea cynaroides]
MSSTKIFLKSSDDKTFEIDETAARASETLKNIIDGGCLDGVIPLPNVSSNILPKVIEYCKKHGGDNGSSKKIANGGVDKDKEILPDYDEEEDKREKVRVDELKKWEEEYMDFDQQVLYDLMLAANYLHIKGLLDLTVEKAASMIRGRTPDQIRENFNINSDFTPEEEEEMILIEDEWDDEWAFD